MSPDNIIIPATPPTGGKPDPTAVKPAGSSSSAIVWLAVLLSLVGIGAGVFSWRELATLKSDTTLTDQIAQRDRRIDDLQRRLEALGAAQADLQTGISTLERADAGTAETLRRLSGSINVSNTELAVAEIEQLLIMAVHRLTLERDVSTALTTLETAQQRLTSLDDPGLASAKTQLAADIYTLRSISPVDITGLSLYLADMLGRVAGLPLNQVAVVEPEPVTTTTVDQTTLPAWQRLIHAVWQEFRSLFVITRTGSNDRATLLPNESWFLYQNLRLQLESARLAVIREDTENLRVSLQQVTAWLNDYFDTSNNDVSNMLQTAGQMTALELAPVLPDISSSLETLRAFIKAQALVDYPVEPPVETPVQIIPEEVPPLPDVPEQMPEEEAVLP